MKIHRVRTSLALAAAVALLAACGGGGGDAKTSAPADQGPEVTPGSKLYSGKAIDGYLVGATVCMDLNANNACDINEPTTKTKDDGSYNIIFDGDATGKKLLVLIDGNTRDLSRPGYVFPGNFTLSAHLAGPQSNISPLTTMVAAQTDVGVPRAEAERNVVTLFGGNINVRDDYIANGDSNTSAFAMQVVDKITEFAKSSQADYDTARNVMNAIIEKGGVASVTQADVDAQALKPVYTTTSDAQALLERQLFTYQGLFAKNSSLTLGRDRWTLSGDTLTATFEEFNRGANAWQPSTETKEVYSMYSQAVVLKSNGQFSGWIKPSSIDSTIRVASVSGNQIDGWDSVTGSALTIQFRTMALDNKSILTVMQSLNDNYIRPNVTEAFAAGTEGFGAQVTRGQDLVVLPIVNHCNPLAPTITEDGVTHCSFLGDKNTAFVSVDDVFGMNVSLDGETGINLSAGGVVKVVNRNGDTIIGGNKVTWTRLDRNPNVLVVSGLTASNLKDIDLSDEFAYQVAQGYKVVIALHNGHLKLGYMLPAGASYNQALLPQASIDAVTSALLPKLPF